MKVSSFALIALAVNRSLPVSAIDTVPSLDVEKYIGRWYQLFGNEYTAQTITRDGTCVAADYGLDEATGNITVVNSERVLTPTGSLRTISGYAYGTDPSEPGQLKVHLGQVPVDGDYWVVGLGPDTFGGSDGAYEWAIVSGPDAKSLFILVRDVLEFEEKFESDVLDFVKDLGFTGRSKEPQRIVQEGCLPFDPSGDSPKRKVDWFDALETMGLDKVLEATNAHEAGLDDAGELEPARDWFDVLATMTHGEGDEGEEDINHAGGWTELLSNVQLGHQKSSWDLVPTVTALDFDRYAGRWYQAYCSFTASALLEQLGACVTADYTVEDKSISLVNIARAGGIDGKVVKRTGQATTTDSMKPGQLSVHLDGNPDSFIAPYWILALGNEQGTGPYSWAIVSDPIRAFLFVLVRDPETFAGSLTEKKVLAMCKNLGFTETWNMPRVTIQEGCTYTPEPTEIAAEEAGGGVLSGVTKLHGDAPGFGVPYHASCKMTIFFPNDGCEEVSDALVSAAEGMMGFENCNGGNKCGYTVSKVGDGKLSLVHETSVQHYKDDLSFTLTDKEDGSCVAKAFSTSETWYALLDNSVNYCNLHNLADASGLEYAEMDVSDSVCTQYSTADCERY